MTRLLVLAALVLAACSGKSPPAIDAASGLAFGATCTVVTDTSTECTSGVCTNTFDMLGHPVCSQKCTMLAMTDPTCPMGASGQKCNMKGYCKP